MKNLSLLTTALIAVGFVSDKADGMAQGVPGSGPVPLPGLARPIFVNQGPEQSEMPNEMQQPDGDRPQGPIAVPAIPVRPGGAPNQEPGAPTPGEGADSGPNLPGNGLGPRPGGGLGGAPSEVLSLDERIDAFFERFDLNGDGLATSREIERAREEGATGRAAMFMAENDFNQDGMVSLDELVMRAVDVASEERAAMAAAFDVDGDGQITPEESTMVHQMRVEARISQALANIGGRSETRGRAGVGQGRPQQEDNGRGNRFGRDTREESDGRNGQNGRFSRNDRDDRGNRGGRDRGNGRGAQRGPDGRGSEIPLVLDSDDDGAITREEIWMLVVTSVGEAQRQFNQHFDMDANGVISADEIAAVDVAGIAERAAAVLEQWDADGNAHITIDELERNPNGFRDDFDQPGEPQGPGEQPQGSGQDQVPGQGVQAPVPGAPQGPGQGMDQGQNPGQVQVPGQGSQPDGRPGGGIRPRPSNQGPNRGPQGPSNRPGRRR